MDTSTEPVQSNVEGSNLKTLKNGAVYDLDKKRIVKGAQLSSEDAANMAKRRAEVLREHKLKGYAEGTRKNTEFEAAQAIAKALAETAIATDSRQQVAAARLIYDDLKTINAREDSKGISLTFEGSLEALQELQEAMRLAITLRARDNDSDAASSLLLDAAHPIET